MVNILIINTVVNLIVIVTSSFISGLYFQFVKGIFHHWILQTFNLVSALFLFYLVFSLCSVLYCNINLKLLSQRKGIFSAKDKRQHLRIISNGVTAGVSKPIFLLFPFLIILMGAKVGRNFVLMGKILNADLFTAGDNVLVGDGVLIACHVVQADTFHFGEVALEDNVTIGIRSVIMPNVKIGSNTIVAANSVVKMGTEIPPNEIWGGIPAKKIGYNSSKGE